MGSTRKRSVWWLAIATLLFFGGGGASLILWVQGRDLGRVFIGCMPMAWQLLCGTLVGALIGTGAWWSIGRAFMTEVRVRYTRSVSSLIKGPTEIWIVSVCAGAGEEIFFRGALQHWMDIPLTALVFVAIHGYLDPRNWRLSIYGMGMTLAMMGLGWMAAHWGLIAPMVAHTIIDVILLGRLTRSVDQSVGNL